MSGDNPRWEVNPLDPPQCLTEQQLYDFWNGDVVEQLHMRHLIKTIFCLNDEIDTSPPLESYVVVCSTEDTALTTGRKVTWRLPYAFELEQMYCELTTAQASGSTFTVDVHGNGTTIFTTKLTIDNTETDSATAAVQPVLLTTTFAARDKFEIDIDQVGDGTATGLKVTFIGRRIA